MKVQYALIFAKESERLPGKHLLEVCGEPMLARIYRILNSCNLFEDVLVYSKYKDLPLKGLNVMKDVTSGVLIDSILSAIDLFGEFLAIGGDMPCINCTLISKFLGEYEGVPIAAKDSTGFPQPLFAVYNRTIYENFRKHALEDRRIYPFLIENFRLEPLSEKESMMLMSVNRRDDLILARKCAGCE
ncbi:MAG: molybdenum cofactor guanylyltransferase [Thermoplasmata archaeon]